MQNKVPLIESYLPVEVLTTRVAGLNYTFVVYCNSKYCQHRSSYKDYSNGSDSVTAQLVHDHVKQCLLWGSDNM